MTIHTQIRPGLFLELFLFRVHILQSFWKSDLYSLVLSFLFMLRIIHPLITNPPSPPSPHVCHRCRPSSVSLSHLLFHPDADLSLNLTSASNHESLCFDQFSFKQAINHAWVWYIVCAFLQLFPLWFVGCAATCIHNNAKAMMYL